MAKGFSKPFDQKVSTTLFVIFQRFWQPSGKGLIIVPFGKGCQNRVEKLPLEKARMMATLSNKGSTSDELKNKKKVNESGDIC
jgi:hypothetical protein